MSARGAKFTVKWKTPVYYSDFFDDFSTNPTSGALATVTNEQSINQSIRNLVLTPPGSRPGRNAIGSKVLNSLFDLGTPASLDVLQGTIKNVIDNYEPRAQDVNVEVDDIVLGLNTVRVTVSYRPVNLPQVVTTVIDLKRVR